MQRMMMRAVRDSGRWKTGIPIARERTMLLKCYNKVVTEVANKI